MEIQKPIKPKNMIVYMQDTLIYLEKMDKSPVLDVNVVDIKEHLLNDKVYITVKNK